MAWSTFPKKKHLPAQIHCKLQLVCWMQLIRVWDQWCNSFEMVHMETLHHPWNHTISLEYTAIYQHHTSNLKRNCLVRSRLPIRRNLYHFLTWFIIFAKKNFMFHSSRYFFIFYTRISKRIRIMLIFNDSYSIHYIYYVRICPSEPFWHDNFFFKKNWSDLLASHQFIFEFFVMAKFFFRRRAVNYPLLINLLKSQLAARFNSCWHRFKKNNNIDLVYRLVI